MSFVRTVYFYNNLRKNLSKSREEILNIRKTKFNKLVKYAYENIPFYKAYYTSFGIKKKDLESINITDLPTINKGILMDNFDKFLSIKELQKYRLKNSYQITLIQHPYYLIDIM